VRSNGKSVSSTGRPILAVGDSFTFGNETEDSETWAAHLQDVLSKRVINAGVGGYGIDQAVLRAELLFDEYDPDVVILSFIGDDVNRTEFSYYPYGRRSKPYFQLNNGSLILRNVPVSRTQPRRRLQGLRRVLGYSFLANAALSRTAERWWQDLPIGRIHDDGENVSVELMVRLDSLTKQRGANLSLLLWPRMLSSGATPGFQALSNSRDREASRFWICQPNRCPTYRRSCSAPGVTTRPQ